MGATRDGDDPVPFFSSSDRNETVCASGRIEGVSRRLGPAIAMLGKIPSDKRALHALNRLAFGPGLAAGIAERYQQSRGNIREVLETLFCGAEFWDERCYGAASRRCASDAARSSV